MDHHKPLVAGMGELEDLRKQLEREIALRKQAEAVLVSRTTELDSANKELIALNESLEVKIEERTKQAEESELRYRQIIDSASDFIYETTGKGIITLVNPVAVSSLGFKNKSEIIGRKFVDFVPEKYKKQVLFFYQQQRIEKEKRSFSVVPVVGINGQWIWIEQNVQYFYNPSGKLLKVSAVGRDVTKRIDSEQELLKASLRLTSLIGSLNAGILVEDEHRKIVLVNEKFCSIFNISAVPNDLIGADCSNSAEETKHLFANPAAFTKRIEQLLNKQQPVSREELLMNDGTVLLRDYTPIFEDETYLGHLWHYLDITEEKNQEKRLKLSEEKYRGLIENMELGLLEVDRAGRIVKAYHRFCEMTGYTSAELVGKKANDLLVPPESLATIEKQDAERLEGKANIYEIEILNKSGERIWVLISGAPFYDEKGVIQGSLGIHYDITDRKRLEEELRIARNKAEKAMLAEKQFLANMSHEIRNPINAIVGMSNLLGDTMLDQQQSDYLKTIKFSTEILLGLISGILDLSKIEAGLYELAEEPVNIREVAESVMKTFEVKAGKGDINFFTDISPEVPEILLADPTAVNQIFINLVGNAAKFTEKGFIVIAAKVLEKIEDSVRVEFSVWDTGIGISADKQAMVFESFKQADKETKLKYGGTGLGLSIVKHLVEMMDGTIQLESEEGQGTTFRVILEVRVGEAQPAVEPSHDSSTPPQLGRVLIVEDNEMNQQYLSGLFFKWKIPCDMANNGVEALEFVENYVYNYILMDIRMPKMDGYETTIRIRSMENNPNSNVPIIALTASALVDERNRALEVGMNYHLTKPFTPEQLLKALKDQKMQEKEKKSADFEFSASLDSEHLYLMYEDDVERASIIFQIFVDGIASEIELLKQLEKEGNEAEFIRKVHKISPKFAMVGLTKVSELLVEIETEGKASGMTDLLKQKFAKFIGDIDPKLQIVQNELARIKKHLIQ
ncbi:MAG: PAS domain S-box protein [Imperialibacter sp.]